MVTTTFKKYKEDVKELIVTLIRIKRPHSPSPTKKVKNKSYITSLKSPNAQMQRMFFACCRLTTVLHLRGGNQLHITEETLGFGSGVKLRVPKGKGFSPYYDFTLSFKNFNFKSHMCCRILGLPFQEFSRARMRTGQQQRPAREQLVPS